MANYTSHYTGSQIDSAIQNAISDHDIFVTIPWKVLSKDITTIDWETNSDTTNHPAKYSVMVSIEYPSGSAYDSSVDIPMVWFMANGSRYYADYSIDDDGSITVYSNTNIAGKVCILGLVHASAVQ